MTTAKSKWRWVWRIGIGYVGVGVALGLLTTRGLPPAASADRLGVVLWVVQWSVAWPLLLVTLGPMD